ncbi:MAG: NADH:flavin oxidoreductase [Tepidisphaeraceae bacterium]|jgi:2,4-dienoyl-CoA reductase-like NADH-dependent reductase (Old Yellow Enzyme family)
MVEETFEKIGHFKDATAFAGHLEGRGLNLPCDLKVDSAAEGSPLAEGIDVGGFRVGNRWCIQPMEGWDATTDGQPSEHTLRRWRHFGMSGCKLVWGGEAFAVQSDGRANPNQLGIIDGDEKRAEKGVVRLLENLRDAHREKFGATDDLLVGLQLTHSGRFCRPHDKEKLEPKILYHHPLLDRKYGIDPADDSVVISDDYIKALIDRYIRAAVLAQRAGFGFVDLKHCHGYLGHEFLSAHTRGGPFGGSLENRTRFLRELISGIQAKCRGLQIGVRISAFDHPPFKPDPSRAHSGKLGPGIPENFAALLPYRWGFGCNPENPLEIDLTEPIALVRMLGKLGVRLINVSCCSPYYNPHFQRPAIFPPSDGYQAPEDPLRGVARQIDVVRQLKQACPDSVFVGSGYTYLQEYLPHVAQATVRARSTDFVGIGRMVLSYFDLPADTLAGRPPQTRRICRTFSECTSAPRNGLISGCYPLDEHYKNAPEHTELKKKKHDLRRALTVVKEV